jgi:hypothetical protein
MSLANGYIKCCKVETRLTEPVPGWAFNVMEFIEKGHQYFTASRLWAINSYHLLNFYHHIWEVAYLFVMHGKLGIFLAQDGWIILSFS